MKRLLFIFVLMHLVCGAFAQRVTDKENRGLVAVPSRTSGNFVSWKVLGEEYYDVTYNLYANGTKVATNLMVSNYTHAGNGSTPIKSHPKSLPPLLSRCFRRPEEICR